MVRASSMVRPLPLPPAPYVTLMKSGDIEANRPSFSRMVSSGVSSLGGNTSCETTGCFCWNSWFNRIAVTSCRRGNRRFPSDWIRCGSRCLAAAVFLILSTETPSVKYVMFRHKAPNGISCSLKRHSNVHSSSWSDAQDGHAKQNVAYLYMCVYNHENTSAVFRQSSRYLTAAGIPPASCIIGIRRHLLHDPLPVLSITCTGA